MPTVNTSFIRYKGIFDLRELINSITDWFEKKGYEHYIYQTKTNKKDFGSEEEYGIRGWVNETEYHRLSMDVYLHLYDAVEVEVTEKGEKKTMTKAAMFIKVSGAVDQDFAERFEHSNFAKRLKKFMNEKVLNWRYGVIWMDDHVYRVEGLANQIKQFLNMNTQGKYY